MDSKYASVGIGNNLKAGGLKRKHAIENIKAKKIKLSNEAAGVSVTNNNKVVANGHNNVSETKIVQESVQDLQVARRRLPVFMVKNRLILFFSLSIYYSMLLF